MIVEERCTRRCNNTLTGAICDSCYAETWTDLCDLPGLYERAHEELTGAGAAGDRVSGSRERPLGVNITALSWIAPARHDAAPGAMLDPDDQTGPMPLADVLTAWARVISDELPEGTPGQRTVWLRPTIDQLVGHIARHFQWACAQPWADDFAQEIRDAAAHGRGITGEHRVVERLAVPCPDCRDRRPCGRHNMVKCETCPPQTLRREYGNKGATPVNCNGCGRLWKDSEYRLLAARMAADLVKASDTGEREADPDDERGGAVPGPRPALVPPLGESEGA